ncbi:MAG: MCE family protein [Nocardioidaceae bacterium]
MTATVRNLLIGGVVLVCAALVAGLLLVIRPGGDGDSHLTVDFDRTVSLYEGADVRILGVPVGQVDSVEPMGEKVRVELSWDSEYKVPANAKAVIVSPAIVGDRYIQLTPAYDSGPEMEDGTVLDASDTAVPVELDRVYESLDELATALGPEGANKDGALDRLLSSSATAFDGQGEKFHRMLKDLSKLTGTLDDNKDELFGSVSQLERFVKALADNDAAVREFNSSLSEVSGMLEGERNDLAGALRALGSSLDEVRTYVADNRSALKGNVDALVDVTDQLVDQRDNLAKIMDTGPTTLANQVLAYNPSVGSLDNRSSIFPGTTVRPNPNPAYNGFNTGLAYLDNPGVGFGVLKSLCAFLAKEGFSQGGFSNPTQRACYDALPDDFVTLMLERGTHSASPTSSEDQLQNLRRSDSDGLAGLMAVPAR